jgi:hypothetical protein
MVPKFIPTPLSSCRRLRLYAYDHRADDRVTGDVQVCMEYCHPGPS